MTKDHWNEHAKQWSYIGAPLRPCAEDIQLIKNYIDNNYKSEIKLNALILGVTPELALMQWPENTNLLAIDRNQAMINDVWPKQELNIDANAICGDWLSTPCDTNSMDIVVGDGCFTLLSYQDHYSDFLREIQRITRPEGCFVIRHFTRPETAENIDDIFTDLLNGQIGNFHIFKWRLAMALHGSIEEGIKVGNIWNEWNKRNISIDQLTNKFGWSKESINTINNYQGVETVYTFPTVKEISEISNQYFEQHSCYFMNYELGDRCPTFFLIPKN